ncbi:MAG: hypothetical protein R3290_09170 [Acidimicrobiia bacterium]|nr:hypothetical protein [Acidimicrobiia bacterium]
MPASISIASIPDDRLDDWRAFQAELAGPRRIEWVQSQRRRGIRREVIWLDADGPTAYYLQEAADPDAAQELDADDPFDAWYAARLDELHPDGMRRPATVFDSSPAPGAWRGLPRGW